MFMDAMDLATTIGIFVAIIAILLVGHEYRYNTIMYTLTSSNSRSKVLLSKIVAITAFALAFTAFASLLAVTLSWLGVSIKGTDMGPQQLLYWEAIWRTFFFVIGYVLAGLLFAVLFRHMVGALVTFLILPTTIEGFASLLLKDNSKYLPFTSLEQVQTGAMLSSPKAALIFSLYLVGGWAIAWFLFLRRDAN
jgi:ABC-type transport system involved in multi-copper enzyme maturation permease subunit